MKVGMISPIAVDNKVHVINMTFEIFPEYFQTLVKTLKIMHPQNHELIRIGAEYDGGYVLIDNFYSNGIAYSFGIRDEISWDNEIADCGYQVFMYDMTIEDIPYHRPEFHFFREGIGGTKDPIQKLDTLENFIARNGHQNSRNMILKMDVEGAEWDFLETVKSETLAQFDQIVLEFHDRYRIS